MSNLSSRHAVEATKRLFGWCCVIIYEGRNAGELHRDPTNGPFPKVWAKS